MAKFGYDVPYQRKPNDATKRLEIFEIIKPYCFSQQDLREIEAYPDNIRAIPSLIHGALQVASASQGLFS